MNPAFNALFENDPAILQYLPDSFFANRESEGSQHSAQQEQVNEPQPVRTQIQIPNFLLYNPASLAWKWNVLSTFPAAAVCLYPIGMIGYALSLPVRVTVVAITLIQMLSTFVETVFKGEFSTLGRKMRVSGMVCLGSIGELVSGILGVACPPVAYKFDEWIQSNSTIYYWYRSNLLSFWRSDLFPITADEGVGNEYRIQQKQELVQDDLSHFRAAKEQLTKYILNDAITYPDTMNLIADLGFLYVCASGNDLKVFLDQAKEKCQNELEMSPIDQLKISIKQIHDIVQKSRYAQELESSSSQNLVKELLIGVSEQLVYEFHLDMEKGVGYDPDEYFVSGVQTVREVKTSLDRHATQSIVDVEGNITTLDTAIKKLSTLTKSISQTLFSVDREMFRAVTQKIF